MANHRLYAEFEARLGEEISTADVPFVNSILNEAEIFALNYTGRTTVPQRLDSAVVFHAVTAYNRRGVEGESSRNEGGIARAFEDLPVTIKRQYDMFRLVGVVK